MRLTLLYLVLLVTLPGSATVPLPTPPHLLTKEKTEGETVMLLLVRWWKGVLQAPASGAVSPGPGKMLGPFLPRILSSWGGWQGPPDRASMGTALGHAPACLGEESTLLLLEKVIQEYRIAGICSCCLCSYNWHWHYWGMEGDMTLAARFPIESVLTLVP